MRVILHETPFYYLTVPGSTARQAHVEKAFSRYSPVAVHPVPATAFEGKRYETTRKSGITGFLRVLDVAAESARTGAWRPFVILEDDATPYRDFPEAIHVPDDCDLCYIGLSHWGWVRDKGVARAACCTPCGGDAPECVRVHNMLSTHGLLVCSVRGLLALQRCLLEDFHRGRGWDITLTQHQRHMRAYALRVPLVYQSAALGGEEEATRLDCTALRTSALPQDWIAEDSPVSNLIATKGT